VQESATVDVTVTHTEL